jgi:hypothetical protein
MAIVSIIQPPGGGREMYEAIAAKMNVDGDPPDGLILHCAGDADGAWQIVEVWESEEHNQRFVEDRLAPAIIAVAGEGAPSRAEAKITTYELHNLVTP